MAKVNLEEYPSAEAFMPAKITLPSLTEAAAGCKGCPLCKTGTQTVFGEGPVGAKVMFVGEQPGDQEDRAGRPFVGPAGESWIRRWRRWGSIGRRCTSPTP